MAGRWGGGGSTLTSPRPDTLGCAALSHLFHEKRETPWFPPSFVSLLQALTRLSAPPRPSSGCRRNRLRLPPEFSLLLPLCVSVGCPARHLSGNGLNCSGRMGKLPVKCAPRQLLKSWLPATSSAMLFTRNLTTLPSMLRYVKVASSTVAVHCGQQHIPC
jgi:hypothetical protein